jgi:hypothetical protein
MPSYKDVYKRPPITDRDWIFQFGKHKGVKLSVVMDADPQYIEWCIEREMIELGHVLLDEFEQMNPWMGRTCPQAKYEADIQDTY